MVIVGRSNIVGKPLAALLLQKAVGANATVTVCHSRTRNIGKYTRQADILVAAMGVPGVARKARAITPVPGGVSPMTIAMLMTNTVTAARRAAERGKKRK